MSRNLNTWDEFGTNQVLMRQCSRKVVSGRRMTVAIRSLVNARSLLVPVLTYGSETMIWREKERSRIRAVQMNSLRGLLDIRKMDKVPNT